SASFHTLSLHDALPIFVNAHAAAIARTLAVLTSPGLEPLFRLLGAKRLPAPVGSLLCIVLRGCGGFAAVRAQPPHQPLSLYRNDRSRRQKGLNAHIYQAGEGTESIIGV